MSDLTGQILGQYHIIELIGRGGMANVYRAYQLTLDRYVAIKVLPAYYAHEPGFAKRFTREAKAVAKLDHPHILPIYDFGQEGDLSYIVVKYVADGTLRDMLDDQPVPPARAAGIISQIAEALDYAHGQGIIHRDVKPSNVLMDRGEWALLMDFGLAKMREGSMQLTASGVGLGTPDYMAPEQGRGTTVDRRTDVYSLGVVLYEMLTGRVPFNAETPMAVALKHIIDPLPIPRALNPEIPEPVERVILKSLAKEPDDRYDTAGELAVALRQALVEAGISSEVVLPLADKVPTVVLSPDSSSPEIVEGVGTIEAAEVSPWRKLPWWVLIVGVVALVGVILGATGIISGGWPPTSSPTVTLPSSATLVTSFPTQVPMPAHFVLAGTPVPQPAAAISPGNAGQVTQLARWGRGTAREMAYSPGGLRLAVASSLGVYLYDAWTLSQMSLIETDAQVWSVAFSLDGTMLAAGLDDYTVRLWRVADGSLLHTLRGHTGIVWSVAFSPDGETLASGSRDHSVRLWQVEDGELLNTLKEHTDHVTSVAFSPDGVTLASGSGDSTVRLWRMADKTLWHTLEGHRGIVWSVAFSPDGMTLASGSWDHTVRLWRVVDGTLLRTLEGHTGAVWRVAFSPDKATLASGSDDDTVRLWQVSDGTPLHVLEEPLGSVVGVAFAPDGATLASGLWNHTVQLWRVADGTLLRTLEGHADRVGSVAFAPDGATLALGSSDDTVQLWRVSDGTLLRTLEGHTGNVLDVTFSPDEVTLASGSSDGTVRLWQISDGALLGTLEAQTGSSVESVAFSPDGATLASGSGYGDHAVRLWRVSDGTLLRTLEGHADYVAGVAFSPDGATLASGSGDGTVRLWQVSDGTPLHTLEGYAGYVTSVAFSPDGMTLASGVEDGAVQLWQVADGKLMRTLEGHTSHVSSVAFSPDGATLVSGSEDGTMWLWRVADGTLLHMLGGHTSDVESVAFAPDGTLLASTSEDGTVRLWGELADDGG